MGRLTTHVLDLASGRPAAGLVVELLSVGETLTVIGKATTNDDGRLDQPILEGAAFTHGIYELRFHAGDYLRTTGAVLSDPPFLDIIPIRFGIADPNGHIHVPLLLSPHGYSTYRGS